MTPQAKKRIGNIVGVAMFAVCVAWFSLNIAVAAFRDFAISERLAQDFSLGAVAVLAGLLITAVVIILSRLSGLLAPFTPEQKQAIQDGLARPRRYWLRIVLWTLAGLLLVFLFNVLQGAGVTAVAIPNSVSNFATDAGPLIALLIVWIVLMIRAWRAHIRKRAESAGQ